MTARPLFKKGLTGWHVLAMLCGFFGVIFSVSATFAYYAYTTFPGDDPSAYRRGLHYNQTLADEARQDQLGWKVSASYEGGRLRIALADSTGTPLAGEQVDARVGRPATGHFDRAASLEAVEPGTYAASLPLEPGYWDVAVRVNASGHRTRFNNKVRLWIGREP